MSFIPFDDDFDVPSDLGIVAVSPPTVSRQPIDLSFLDAAVWDGLDSEDLEDVIDGLAALQVIRVLQPTSPAAAVTICDYLLHVRQNLLSAKVLGLVTGGQDTVIKYYAADPSEQQALTFLQQAWTENRCGGQLPLVSTEGYPDMDPPPLTPPDPGGTGTLTPDASTEVGTWEIRLWAKTVSWVGRGPHLLPVGPRPVAGVEVFRDFRNVTGGGNGSPTWRRG